jgi:hypothetical protein
MVFFMVMGEDFLLGGEEFKTNGKALTAGVELGEIRAGKQAIDAEGRP